MDTKLKKYNKKYNKLVANLIVVILVFTASIGILFTYKPATQNNVISKDVLSTRRAADYFSDELYGMYWKMKQETEGISEPSQIFLTNKDKEAYVKKIDNEMGYPEEYAEDEGNGITITKEIVEEDFNRSFEDRGYSDLISRDESNFVKYNIYNKNNKKVSANESKDLDFIRNAALNPRIFDDTKNIDRRDKIDEKYLFYIVLDFDKDGNLNIESIKGADKSVYEDVLLNYKNSENSNVRSDNLFVKYYDEYVRYNLPPIKDTVMTLGVTNKSANAIQLTPVINSGNYNGMKYLLSENKINALERVYACIAVVAGIFGLIGLLIPNSVRNDIFGMKSVIKVPIEIIITIVSILSAGIVYTSAMIVDISAGNIMIKKLMEFIPISINTATVLSIFINIVYWMVIFALALMLGIYVRDLFSKVSRREIAGHSIFVRCLKWIVNKIKSFLKWMNNLDLKDGYEKFILAALGVNFLAITICSSIWGFGIITGAIYSVILYGLIKKKFGKVLEDYNKLETITEDIANGDFGSVPEEDLGVFNPIKENLENIEKGFSAAVSEEVKSQKMKTELITNVSHDLKTPLTSIITYVDLLKKEGITEEERQKYLDTIDKKSNRLKFLIEDLFEVSKATSGNVTMNPMKVDVVSLIKQTLVELEDKLNAAHLEVKGNFPEEKVILELDSMRTFRIFSNLISNISKYSMPYTRVYINVKRDAENTEIEFKNISAEELNGDVENLTERFVRGDKSRNTEGSGLGLAIAKSFTELQDGKMKVSSDGDLFKVVLTFKNERNLKKDENNQESK